MSHSRWQRGAFARPGPSCQQVPRRQGSYAALRGEPSVPMRLPSEAWPRLPRLLRPWLRFPSPTTYLLGQALFCRLSRRPARAPANAPASEIDHRLSVRPETPEERQGPPGLLGRPLPACRTRSLSAAPPLRIRPLLTPTSLREDLRRGRRRLHGKQNARHPEMTSFSRPRTHGPHDRVPTLRRSRYRDRRKARYRLGRAPPRRAGFAPAGQQTKFHGVIASSNPNRPAEPGRTESTILTSRFSRQCNSRNS